MRRPDTKRSLITLAVLTLSLYSIVFAGIEPTQAVEYSAVIVQPALSFNGLSAYLGPLDDIISGLSNIFKKAPAEKASESPAEKAAESNQALPDTGEKNVIGSPLLVHIKDSNLLIEDNKGNVISKRKPGSDDAGAIREAINKIDQGTILCIGTFQILSPIDNLKSSITLKGLPGKTVFDCSKMRSTVFLCDNDGLGYAEHTTPLLDDVLKGSGSIKVQDTKSYHEGDFIKLIDNEGIDGFKKGEILRIERISGNEVILDGAVRDDYTVENAASIRKLAMTNDIAIEGIKFVGPGIETNLALFSLNLLHHFSFVNNSVSNFGRAAIYLSDSLNGVIENNKFENIYMTGFGYSISIGNACSDIYIIDNAFSIKGRHYITMGAGTGSRNSGGFARNIRVINNSFEDSDLEAINSHPPFTGPIEIIGNTFNMCAKGVKITNGNTVIAENKFIKCPIGIQLLGDEERTHYIRSNNFEGCDKNIELETSNMTINGGLYSSGIRVNKDHLDFL